MPFRCCRPTDATYREVGLNLAAATMRRGERCRLWAPPAYGYGDRGSFSFPTVPPGAHLVYDLELLDWEDPEEERDRASLTYEERLEAAERRRQDGNALYGEGRYAEAERKYRLAVSYINEDLLIQLGDFHFDKAVAVRRPAQLNIAACQLRLGDLHGAVATCSEVLAEDGGNAKALFRRGKARRALGDARGAAEDLRLASRELEAAGQKDPAVLRELAAAEVEVAAAERAGDEVLRRAFARSVGKRVGGKKGGGGGGLFPEEEDEKKKEEEERGSASSSSPLPPPPPRTTATDGAATGSQRARKRGAPLPAPLMAVAVAVLAAVVALVAAAAVARLGVK